MTWTEAELRLMALSDLITDVGEDRLYVQDARARMAKARAAKKLRAAQEADRREQARKDRKAAIVAQRAAAAREWEARMEARRLATIAAPPDARICWADRIILATLPATIDQIERRLRDLNATKVPRVIEGRLQRLERLGLAVREGTPSGSMGVFDGRWTPTGATAGTADRPKSTSSGQVMAMGAAHR